MPAAGDSPPSRCRSHDEQQDLVARLREEIRRIERRAGRRSGVIACGLPAIDVALPGGGFPRGALTELSGGCASGKTAVALSLLAALPPEALCSWVDGRGELYPPAVQAWGVDLTRLLLVRPPLSSGGLPTRGGPPPWKVGIWAAEALLASGAFTAVVVEVALPRAVAGADAIARRLQAAAERGGAIGLWISTPPAALRIPAAARLEVSTEDGRIVARSTGAGERRRKATDAA